MPQRFSLKSRRRKNSRANDIGDDEPYGRTETNMASKSWLGIRGSHRPGVHAAILKVIGRECNILKASALTPAITELLQILPGLLAKLMSSPDWRGRRGVKFHSVVLFIQNIELLTDGKDGYAKSRSY